MHAALDRARLLECAGHDGHAHNPPKQMADLINVCAIHLNTNASAAHRLHRKFWYGCASNLRNAQDEIFEDHNAVEQVITTMKA